MSKRSLTIVVMSFLFFLCSNAWGVETPVPLRIYGNVTVNGEMLTSENDEGYKFVVTVFTGEEESKVEDADGLSENGYNYYIIDIPNYDASKPPEGAEIREGAVIRVYKDGRELIVTKPDGGRFNVSFSDTGVKIDLEVTEPSILPAKIEGTVMINGGQIKGEQGGDYHFFVTKSDGSRFISSINANDMGEDTDGFNGSDLYEIYIPTYDQSVQPDGAKAGDDAVIHVVYKDKPEYEYTVKIPDGGQFEVGSSGSVIQIDLELEGPPVLYVSPSSHNVPWMAGALNFDVTWLGVGTIEWEATVDGKWLEITSGSSGQNSGTIIVEYNKNNGALRNGTISITIPDTSARSSVTIEPQYAKVTQTCPCDVDADGIVEIQDVISMLKVLIGSEDSSLDILPGSGSIGLKDIIYALDILSMHEEGSAK